MNVEAFTALWARGVSGPRIAQAMGCTRQAVYWHAKHLGLPARGHAKPGKARVSDELFARMWEAGVCSGEIRAHYGYTQAAQLSRRAKRLGLAPRGRCSKARTTLAAFFEAELGRKMQEAA